MRLAPDIPVADERAARADLRGQIAALEARAGRAPAAGGPRVLSLGELERVRDALAARPRPQAGPDPAARLLLERMLGDPAAHRGARVPLAALGAPGCGVYQVRPRLGLIGRLAGWWEVKLSSGCPLAMRVVCALAAALVLSVPASALGHGRRAATFSGSCRLSGAVSFLPALTNVPQRVEQPASAAGTCTGTFTDRAGRRHRLSEATAAYAATSIAPSDSCLAGTATGTGTLTFPYGRLRFAMSETRAAAAPLLVLNGARAGSAVALVTPSPTQDPVATLAACAGAGLEAFAFDGRLQTAGRIAG